MREKQTHIKTLNDINKINSDCEFYSDMANFFDDLNMDENIAPFLNGKLASGEIKSIEDLSDFFTLSYRSCVNKAQQLARTL